MRITSSNQKSSLPAANAKRRLPALTKDRLEAALQANDIAAATALSHTALNELSVLRGGPVAVDKLRASLASSNPAAMDGAVLYAECILLGFGPHNALEAKDGAMAAHKAAAFLLKQTSREPAVSSHASPEPDAEFFAALSDLPEQITQPAYVEHDLFAWTNDEPILDAGTPNCLYGETVTPRDESPTTPRFDDQFFTRLRSPSLPPLIALDMPALSASPRTQKLDGFGSQLLANPGTISLQSIDLAARSRSNSPVRAPIQQPKLSPVSVHATPEPEIMAAVGRKREREGTGELPDAAGAPSKKRGRKTANMADRLFPCDHCEWRFARAEHLRRHVRSVNRELNFQCTFDYCDKRFTRSDNRDQHARTHADAGSAA